jgi:hypothetical protein
MSLNFIMLMQGAIVFNVLGGSGVAVFCHSLGKPWLLGLGLGLSLGLCLPESPFT